MPTTNATTRIRLLDRKTPPAGCSGGVDSWPGTGPDSLVTSAADECIPGYSHRDLSADARRAPCLGTYYPTKRQHGVLKITSRRSSFRSWPGLELAIGFTAREAG